jgi:hypothetical protein
LFSPAHQGLKVGVIKVAHAAEARTQVEQSEKNTIYALNIGNLVNRSDALRALYLDHDEEILTRLLHIVGGG